MMHYLLRLREAVRQAQGKPEDDRLFAEAVRRTLIGATDQQEAAEAFRVSRSRVYRWSRGENLPELAVRQSVLRWMMQKVETKISEEQKSR